jgi:DNA (cytosine-5)-methyltransferase 1
MEDWHCYEEFIRSLEILGYDVKQIVLNATTFGVPQSRERLFILCSLFGELNLPEPVEQTCKPASNIINTNGKYSYSLLRKKGRAERTIASAERAIETLGNNIPFLLVYYGSGRNGNGGWQRIDQPLGTITTLDRFAYVVPGESGHMMRMLQPEELKLAMGYRSDFKLDEIKGLTRRERIKLMGNGVCPPVMEAILRSMIVNDRS